MDGLHGESGRRWRQRLGQSHPGRLVDAGRSRRLVARPSRPARGTPGDHRGLATACSGSRAPTRLWWPQARCRPSWRVAARSLGRICPALGAAQLRWGRETARRGFAGEAPAPAVQIAVNRAVARFTRRQQHALRCSRTSASREDLIAACAPLTCARTRPSLNPSSSLAFAHLTVWSHIRLDRIDDGNDSRL